MRNVVTAGLGALTSLVLAACGNSDTAAEGEPDRAAASGAATPGGSEKPELLLDFDSLPASEEPVVAVPNKGSASLVIWTVSSGTARMEVVDGRTGGRAVRFPAWVQSDTAPSAVLFAADEMNLLNPGDRDFALGASFTLDTQSEGTAVDDGNNLIQRGGFEGGQFKIQVDKRVPSCRVAGDKGEVFVQADAPVVPTQWYTVSCERSASQVTLTVLHRGAGEQARTFSSSGPIGTLSLDADPISIGGKIGPDGAPVASADQFNGVVDDVFVQIE